MVYVTFPEFHTFEILWGETLGTTSGFVEKGWRGVMQQYHSNLHI